MQIGGSSLEPTLGWYEMMLYCHVLFMKQLCGAKIRLTSKTASVPVPALVPRPGPGPAPAPAPALPFYMHTQQPVHKPKLACSIAADQFVVWLSMILLFYHEQSLCISVALTLFLLLIMLCLQAGFIDAFVLRNCMKCQNTAILQQCSDLDAKDAELAAILNVLHISSPAFGISGAFGRISHRVGQLAAHVMTVLLAGALVVALLITASVMRWTTTAQLLCNTPTMIIEGGMLLVLMMAHMASHQYMRARLQTLLHRRVAFQSAFDHKQINLESLPMPKAAKEADM